MKKPMVMAALVTIGTLWSLRVILFYCESCVGSLDVPKHLEASCEEYEQVSVNFTPSGPPRYIDCSDAVDALARGDLVSVNLIVDSSRVPSFGLLRHIKLCQFSAHGGSGDVAKAETCTFESNGL